MDKQVQQAAMRAMLKKVGLSPEEAERRFQLACSQKYWQDLNPQLSVGRTSVESVEAHAIDSEERQDILRHLKLQHYFSTTRPLIQPAVAARMLQGVAALRKAGWHEVFGFVYDEFWQVTRTPSLRQLLADALGEEFKALPQVVVHYVHPGIGAGWGPHVDFSDRCDRFTIWLALSDATVSNGCMYILPYNRIPQELRKKWASNESLGREEVKKLLHATQTLPVSAGCVLGWEGDVIHWGAHSTDSENPRVSLSVVYIRAEKDPMVDEIPLLSAHTVPGFPERLISVGNAIRFYQVHVPALRKFSVLGQRLIREFNP